MSVQTLQADEQEALSHIPMGRSRALAVLGGLLFSAALQVTNPRLARATHLPTPYPCGGYPECDCCAGFSCCPQNTCGPVGQYHGCSTGLQCWYTCDCSDLYKCCDWTNPSNGQLCICSGWIQPCSTC